ncbi:hypothetical protein X953_02940 [Virgibacillus sp. SK37]|nr:hypothetical protein X953_02940 [Virgibacillus sp. SK37]
MEEIPVRFLKAFSTVKATSVSKGVSSIED